MMDNKKGNTDTLALEYKAEGIHLIDAENYLPDFLKESKLILSIIDCLNALLSDAKPIFRELFSAHTDMLYRTRNYFALSYAAKIEIVKELGFGYLLDILTLNSEQLSRLLIFFNLIYTFKGKREGLDICLTTLGMNYTYTTWEDMEPKGQPFTAALKIIGNDYFETQVFAKIRNFIRSYMLPWIDITIELTVDMEPIYIYPSAGLLTRFQVLSPFTAVRDVVPIAIYDDEPAYDIQYYGPDINDGAGQYIPYEFPKSILTINVIPESAKVIIDGEQTKVKEIEQGKVAKFFVEANGYESYQNHIVLTGDKVINLKLNKI